jgi:hypothetical protein
MNRIYRELKKKKSVSERINNQMKKWTNEPNMTFFKGKSTNGQHPCSTSLTIK